MSTVTADLPRLPSHCPHKLPASCALTATPKCCACVDRRPHASAYAVYIDGLGSVLRGTRWERYCWTCKAFWEARLAATNPLLEPAQTRIPDFPEQTAFLAQWHDYHRGYTTVTLPSGAIEQRPVLGEPLKDVAIGHLPCSLAEVAVARDPGQQASPNTTSASQAAGAGPVELPAPSPTGAQGRGRTNDMVIAVSQASRSWFDDVPTASEGNVTRHHRHTSPTEFPTRRIAGLRRDLRRMRRGIERIMMGLHELGEEVPEARQVATASADVDRLLGLAEGELLARWETAGAGPGPGPTLAGDITSNVTPTRSASRQEVARARAACDQALLRYNSASEHLRDVLQRHQNLEQEHRALEHFTSVFGTREEVERQGAEYESPISGMFARAWGTYREREQERRRDRLLRDVLVAEDRMMSDGPRAHPDAELAGWERHRRPEYGGLVGARLPETPFGLSDSPHSRARGTSYLDRDEGSMTDYYGTLPGSSRRDRPRDTTYVGVGNEDLLHYLRRDVASPLHGRPGEERFFEGDYGSSGSSLDGRGLDDDDGRPPPLEDADMTVSLSCKVCYSQVADTAVLPCGHLVMCQVGVEHLATADPTASVVPWSIAS
ncbi:MAG: hypothetical protein M1838_003873 [Thelocarpon superellum]|nr:MAG: hypothetical protein M1838_003873 [Thelocarpon superellum]